MNRIQRIRRLVLAATALGFVAAGRTGWAQQLKVAAPMPGDVAAPRQPTIRLNENTFNQWALGPGTTTQSIHDKLESRLSLRIDHIQQVCTLTDGQKKRLHLAGQGDIKRLYNRLEAKKRTIVDVPVEQGRLNEILRDLQPLRFSLQSDPFGDGSIFSKILKSTLDREQLARFEKDERERTQFRHQASIDLTVAMFDRVASLGGEQRRQFADLLKENTQPPKKSGPYDYYVLLFQLDAVPEKSLRAILEESQMVTLQHQVQRAHALETTLRSGGYLPDEPAWAKAAGEKDQHKD